MLHYALPCSTKIPFLVSPWWSKDQKCESEFSHTLGSEFPILNENVQISNGNRTEWSPIRSVIIRVINKIGRPRRGSPICLITSMITDRIGRHEVLLPINHNLNKICNIIGYFLNQNTRNSKFCFASSEKKTPFKRARNGAYCPVTWA